MSEITKTSSPGENTEQLELSNDTVPLERCLTASAELNIHPVTLQNAHTCSQRTGIRMYTTSIVTAPNRKKPKYPSTVKWIIN